MTVTCDIEIDGSEGEGGGQILRSSLALSIITGRSFRLTRIRAGRKTPGLMRQHLTCVTAAAEISSAEVQGAQTGSREISFLPGPVCPGTYHFRIGTAGSATLVLQTVLPPLLTASAPSVVTVEGGTHNMQAPPFDFLQRSWIPLIRRFGPNLTAHLHRHGFYPAGGGSIQVDVEPSPHLHGFDLLEAGRLRQRRLRALVSRLPQHIGERELNRAQRKLNWPGDTTSLEEVTSNSPGNVLLAELEHEHLTTVCTEFGQKGVRAEQVADGVVRSVRRWMKHQAPVGPHLADQLMLPMALSAAQPADCGVRRGGRFLTGPLTEHSRTHLSLLPRFLNIEARQEPDNDGVLVEFAPRAGVA